MYTAINEKRNMTKINKQEPLKLSDLDIGFTHKGFGGFLHVSGSPI